MAYQPKRLWFRLDDNSVAGHVYYDPAVKMEAKASGAPAIKRRSQFRVKHAALGQLYQAGETVELG